MPDDRVRGRVGRLDRLIRRIAEDGPDFRASERELLVRFVTERNEAAFRALVCRHGPMVFRVCLRVLGREHDAEDAFQATFLVLAQCAASVQKADSVGSWLFGVAHRVSMKMRAAAARRLGHEREAVGARSVDPLAELSVREAQQLLDAELAALPEKYRAPIVLCCLEGFTRDEAAKQLGWELSKLKSRLEQAREVLRTRLASRGLTLPAAFLATLLVSVPAAATVPAELVDAVGRSAAMVAACGSVTTCNATAVAAAEGVIRAMALNKIKKVVFLLAATVFVGAVVGASAIALAHSDPQRGSEAPTAHGRGGPPVLPVRADEKKESPEEKVTRLGLVSVRQIRQGITTKPTAQAPNPPVIHFFRGQKNEIRVAPGQSALVELPKPAKELAWEIPGYTPEAVGDEEDPEFEYVLCQWDAKVNTNLVFTLYRRPAKGEKGTPPPVFPVPIEEDTPEEKAEKVKLEKQIKELKLDVVHSAGSFVDPKPTARILKPVIYFFKGQKNEIQLVPGRTVLIELPKPVKELAWVVAEGKPASTPGITNGPEFEFVLCRWEKHGDVMFTAYRRPVPPGQGPKEEPAKPGNAPPVGAEPRLTDAKNGADLTKIDRAIQKEPRYTSTPYYALLAFGPDAVKRVWVVLDGDVLYVDRNGNGDLTEDGERIAVTSTKQFSGTGAYSQFKVFDLGNLGELRGKSGEMKFQLNHWIRNPDFVPKTDFDKAVVKDRAQWEQATLWRVAGDDRAQNPITFTRRPADAQISHLGGPLTVRLRFPDSQTFRHGSRPAVLQVVIGTPGVPAQGNRVPVFAPVLTTEVPADVHPQAEIEFPGLRSTDKPIRVTVALDRRCCGDNFHAPVSVPLDAGTGKAKVTVSFPDWKEGLIAPVTFEVSVEKQTESTRTPR